jgi:glucokinase
MTRDYYIAVDLGGTNIRAALFSATDSAKIIRCAKVATEARRGVDAVLDTICRTVEQVMPDDGAVRGVGMGAPGPLDPFLGVVIQAPNLPGWINIPARQRLEDRLKLPIRLGNDANLAALGEWKFGAGRGTQDLIYLTISTGIGGGIISGGRLLLGAHGLAGEPGHMTVVPDGPLCGCGGRGHLEAVSSGTAIARRARELLQSTESPSLLRDWAGGDLAKVDARLVGRAASEGDELALLVYREAGTYLGRAVADMLVLFNPGIVVIGGGVARSWDILFDPVRSGAETYVMNASYLKDLRIVPAELGDDAGLYGAFALFLDAAGG